MDLSPRTIFHVDMDAFFASVEQRDNPSFRGKPVIVGAQPGTRGVVSAASYEARKFGVHSAMPISEAYRRCPNGIFVRVRMDAYAEESERIMEIFRSFTPLVEQVSVDEAFLDMTGTGRLHGSPLDAAQRLSMRIRQERNLTGSVGIAPNKFLAKVASDMHKPNGITVVPRDSREIVAWLAPLPVGKIWGVGKKTQEVLVAGGVRTVGDMQALSIDELRRRFGASGDLFFELSRGIDDRPVGGEGGMKSISREHTFNVDSGDVQEWTTVLRALAADVAQQARAADVKGHTVVFIYRTPDFTKHTRRMTLTEPTWLSREIFDKAMSLLKESHLSRLRLIGVGLTNFDAALQLDLFDGADTRKKAWEASEQALDRIQAKFGRGAVRFGGETTRG